MQVRLQRRLGKLSSIWELKSGMILRLGRKNWGVVTKLTCQEALEGPYPITYIFRFSHQILLILKSGWFASRKWKSLLKRKCMNAFQMSNRHDQLPCALSSEYALMLLISNPKRTLMTQTPCMKCIPKLRWPLTVEWIHDETNCWERSLECNIMENHCTQHESEAH